MEKIGIVTGGTSGIGGGIARRLLSVCGEEGRVYVTYGHDEGQAESFRESLREEDQGKLRLIRADMSSYEAMMEFGAAVREEAGHVDWLVNNVGISTYAPFSSYTFEEWNQVLQTNLSIPAFLVRELAPLMRRGGSVLFTGSYAGQQAYSSSLVYGVTKAAVHFLAKALVKELEPMGVTVNAIAPGFIQTPWHQDRTRESYERIEKKIALHRFGTPEEVADMALAILTNGYMNGSVVDIHGGYDYF